MIVPKTEVTYFSLADTGTDDMGSNTLDPGKVIIAFKK